MYIRIPELNSNDLKRFWDKVDRLEEEDSWNWVAGASASPDSNIGYGCFYIKASAFKSHRVSFYIEHGFDPGDLLVCHTCDNRLCCNPNHLFLGTHLDNIQDRDSKGRQRAFFYGEDHAGCKLLDEEVNEIRNSKAQGVVLAKIYGVTPTTISKIRTSLYRSTQG